jgi:aminoglycoside phosphotransferase (APT) family kinase protein
VVDWEYACTGDPAYDLAIVTRGARQPFQVSHGLAHLLDAYAAAGGRPLRALDVYFHEPCLAARWYRLSLEHPDGGEPPDEAFARMRRVLGRARVAAHMARG